MPLMCCRTGSLWATPGLADGLPLFVGGAPLFLVIVIAVFASPSFPVNGLVFLGYSAFACRTAHADWFITHPDRVDNPPRLWLTYTG